MEENNNNKPVQRMSVMQAYVNNAVTYLHTLYPDVDPEELTAQVKNIVKERYQQACLAENSDDAATRALQWPKIQVLYHSREGDDTHQHDYGNLTLQKDVDLFRYLNQQKDKVITPFGSVYETADNLESFLKGMIDGKGKDRKREKKKMFLAKKEGNRTAEVFHNNAQANIKINMNSIIGAMGANFNFLSDIANFNSVTSTGRHFIMTAYAHAERFLQSNFYFRSTDQLFNFLVTSQNYGPSDEHIIQVLNKYPIHQPNADEVYHWLAKQLQRYNFQEEYPEIQQYVANLSQPRLTWIYYMSNMRQLVMKNETFFRPWMDRFFNVEAVDTSAEVDPNELNNLDGDLSVVLATVCHQMIPTNKSGNSINLSDCITAAPEIAKKLVHYGHHLQACIDEIQDLFDLFMDHNVGIGYLPEHKNMFRDAVILSDTDSIIFTTREWAQWYLGSTLMTPMAYNVNALVVYWLSKATARVIYHLSYHFGAVGADINRMNMKNEFMMPVEILTTLKKHYASILKIQEGVFYGTPRLDIKGGGLRGSSFSKGTLNYVTWFIQSVLDDIYTKGEVSLSEYIVYVLRFEQTIRESLKHGETRFLTVEPVKNDDEYQDADRSIYFNYLFWESAFAEKYGSIMIPTKCYILPLLDLRSNQFQEAMRTQYPDTLERMMQFCSKYPKKNISRIPLNPVTNQIPDELKLIMNYRNVIYSNTSPMYLILNSLGLDVGTNSDQCILFTDLYGQIQLTDNDREVIDRICSTGTDH